MPFENVTRDSRIFWLGEASAVLLADDLNALGADAITREERREAFDRLQVPPAASLTDATVIRIGQLVGAAQVVVGTLQARGRHAGRQCADHRPRRRPHPAQRDRSADRSPTCSRSSSVWRVRSRRLSARTTEEVEREHPPLAAFENYIKGLLAETPATAISYLNTALQLQPTFDRARLALWDVYTEQGDHERALAAVAARRCRARRGHGARGSWPVCRSCT